MAFKKHLIAICSACLGLLTTSLHFAVVLAESQDGLLPQGLFAADITDVDERMSDISTVNDIVGDGDPYQQYLYIQTSHSISCNHRTCGVSRSEQKGYAVSWSYDFSASLGPIAEFVTVGFGLGASFTTSTSTTLTDSCHGVEGDDICVWWRVGFTSLLVNATVIPAPHWLKEQHTQEIPGSYQVWWNEDFDYEKHPENPVRIRLPNANGWGCGAVCGLGSECITQGFRKWGNATVPGGPQKYPFSEHFM